MINCCFDALPVSLELLRVVTGEGTGEGGGGVEGEGEGGEEEGRGEGWGEGGGGEGEGVEEGEGEGGPPLVPLDPSITSGMISGTSSRNGLIA